jgi:hypothetical protein
VRPPRRRTLRALAGAVSAALICTASLNGCSSSAQTNGTIAGAASAAPAASPTSAPSASTAAVAGLDLSFRIPADVRLEFQTRAQSSTTAGQIETILVDQYEAYVEALSSGGSIEANYRLLTVAGALGTENSEITWWKQHGERVTGTDRLYDFTVGATSGEMVSFSYCEDSTALQYKNLSTGATIPNTSSAAANHTLREGQVIKGKGELWAVTTLLTQNGAQQCMHD